MNAHLVQAGSAFLAGLGTSLSPCVYPMIPISLGFLGARSGKESPRGKVFGFFLGQVAAYTSLGVAAVFLGEIFGFSSELPGVQIATGLLFLVFAGASFFNRIPSFLLRVAPAAPTQKASGVLGAFVVGASSAAVASPCTTPVVGGVLTAVSQVQERAWGLSLMFFFAVGLSCLFLLAGLGLAKVKSLPRAGRWMTVVHKISSLALAFAGIYFVGRGMGVL